MRLNARKSANPLDARMTKAQVVRRKFKSGLPRKIENRVISPMEALAKTMELLDKLRTEMRNAGLDENDVSAGLMYCQPYSKSERHVLVKTAVLPKLEEIGEFCMDVIDIERPLFLGVIFHQVDREAKEEKYKYTVFVWPFMAGPEYEGRMIAARDQIAKGGAKKAAN